MNGVAAKPHLTYPLGDGKLGHAADCWCLGKPKAVAEKTPLESGLAKSVGCACGDEREHGPHEYDLTKEVVNDRLGKSDRPLAAWEEALSRAEDERYIASQGAGRRNRRVTVNTEAVGSDDPQGDQPDALFTDGSVLWVLEG